MEFDFSSYLAALDPDVPFQIKRLAGGVVNITVRAAKSAPDVDNGRFLGRSSVILKYAPPFIAGVGESAPMSTFRQTIEARALGLFLSSRPDSLHSILQSSGVDVPELLNHDAESSVLVLSDLGVLPNLSDIFSDLGGYTPGNPAISVSHLLKLGKTLDADEITMFEEVGSRLGHFFRQLHSKETLQTILSESSPRYLENPDVKDVVLDHGIRPIREHLKLFPHLVSQNDADLLCSCLIEDFLRQTSEEEQAMILGDCWTGAVLVDTESVDAKPRVGVIDWEFASIGRGISGDMSQFMAHLELFRLVADQDVEFSGHRQALDAIVSGLTQSYSCTDRAGGDSKIRPVSIIDSTRMRSAFLSHGAEMINCAFWKVWVCREDQCPAKNDPPASHECKLIRKMVERGVWFLRHATTDQEAFSQDDNWAQIEMQQGRFRSEGKQWLIDLF